MIVQAEGSSRDDQIRLKFTTREPELALADNGPILVPTSFRRVQLSALVNGLLHQETTIPLEFLIDGSYLRTTIDEYINLNNLSAETTLQIEYVRARTPPRHAASLEHDDWVADVDVFHPSSTDGSDQARIVTSGFDNHLRVWNTSVPFQVLATSPVWDHGGHSRHVQMAKFLSISKIVSASDDSTIRVWNYTEEGSPELRPRIRLLGHKSEVKSVNVHKPSQRILSASSDGTVGLWSSSKSDAPIYEPPARPNKRRKGPAVTVPERGPLSMLKGHETRVDEAIFDANDATVCYSAGWDATVRTWDLTTSTLVDTRTMKYGYRLFCLEQMPEPNLLAAGSTDTEIKLLDPRTSATTVTAMTLKGHKNDVRSLSCDPNNGYRLLSGANDGCCRIWDIRGTKKTHDGVTGQCLYTIKRRTLGNRPAPVAELGYRVFGVLWDKELGILSAGQDKAVQIDRIE